MDNARFSTALHIMSLLAMDEQAWLTSRHIAGSINMQAAAVRKELAVLREAGLVTSREGKHGGVKLGRPASGIRLSEIYETVSKPEKSEKIKSPNPGCFVGKQINFQLNSLFSTLDEAILKEMKQLSLAQFYQRFN